MERDPAGAVGRQIDAVVDDAVEHQRLDMVAVFLQIGRGVEGAVGAGVGDQAVVLAQGLPDVLDVGGRILADRWAINSPVSAKQLSAKAALARASSSNSLPTSRRPGRPC